MTEQPTTTDQQLRLFIERVERMESDKKDISDDIRDVYSEAKAQGYIVKTMRELIKLRKMAANDRAEQEMLLETYKASIGLS